VGPEDITLNVESESDLVRVTSLLSMRPLADLVQARYKEALAASIQRTKLKWRVADKAVVQASTAPSLGRLRGLGKEIWENVDPLEYVASLRGEWE
jgi:hypothetical protein